MRRGVTNDECRMTNGWGWSSGQVPGSRSAGHESAQGTKRAEACHSERVGREKNRGGPESGSDDPSEDVGMTSDDAPKFLRVTEMTGDGRRQPSGRDGRQSLTVNGGLRRRGLGSDDESGLEACRAELRRAEVDAGSDGPAGGVRAVPGYSRCSAARPQGSNKTAGRIVNRDCGRRR